MKTTQLKNVLLIFGIGLIGSSKAQSLLVSPPTGAWKTPNSPTIFETTTSFGLGVGTTTPRAWQEILYCKTPNNDEVGFIVTKKNCTNPNVTYNWTANDNIGVLHFVEGGEPNPDPPFVINPNTLLNVIFIKCFANSVSRPTFFYFINIKNIC